MLEGIVHGMFATPSAAIGGLQRLLEDLCVRRAQKPTGTSSASGSTREPVAPSYHSSRSSPASSEPDIDAAFRPYRAQRVSAGAAAVELPPRPPTPSPSPPHRVQAQRVEDARAEPTPFSSPRPFTATPPAAKRTGKDMVLMLSVIGAIGLLASGLWLVPEQRPLITSPQSARALKPPDLDRFTPPREPTLHDSTVKAKSRSRPPAAPSKNTSLDLNAIGIAPGAKRADRATRAWGTGRARAVGGVATREFANRAVRNGSRPCCCPRELLCAIRHVVGRSRCPLSIAERSRVRVWSDWRTRRRDHLATARSVACAVAL